VFVNKYYKECQDAGEFCRVRSDLKLKIDLMWDRKEYTSNLTDAEWLIMEPLLPQEQPVGRKREVDLREVLNAINDRADNGVKWRNLPSDFPAWQTVYSYFRIWVRLGIWESISRKSTNGLWGRARNFKPCEHWKL
jgi:transposase